MNLFKKTGIIITGIIFSIALNSIPAYAADYSIAPKDSLYIIGTLFNTSVNTLMAENKLNSDLIYPGQTLKVPAKLYTVKKGDSLYLIAKKHGISLTSLRKANNKWDNLIIPNQTLLIPGGKLIDNVTLSSNNAKTVIPYTEAEVDLLARLITAEAEGESYDAKVGVGAVVVNRVQSSDWPSSISAVINQVFGEYYQFTPVENGQIHKKATDDSIKAAWAALYGSDPSNGAMFYFDDSSTNQWIRSKTVTARIDSMIFVR